MTPFIFCCFGIAAVSQKWISTGARRSESGARTKTATMRMITCQRGCTTWHECSINDGSSLFILVQSDHHSANSKDRVFWNSIRFSEPHNSQVFFWEKTRCQFQRLKSKFEQDFGPGWDPLCYFLIRLDFSQTFASRQHEKISFT